MQKAFTAPEQDNQAWSMAQLAYRKTVYTEYIKNHMEENPDLDPSISEFIKDNIRRKQEQRNVKGRDWAFITVNPDTTKCSLEEFLKKVTKATSKVWIEHCIYAFEQRGKTPEERGQGYHVHILLKRPADKRECEIKREFLSSFKKCIGNDKHVNISFGPMADWDKVLAYVRGMKKGNPKPTRAIDCRWREENDIKEFYEITPENPNSDFLADI